RIGLEFVHVPLMGRREGVVGGGPALPLLVPLEHGKIGHPQEAKVSADERSMLRGIPLRQRHTQQAGSRIDRVIVLLDFGLYAALGRMSSGLTVSGDDHD